MVATTPTPERFDRDAVLAAAAPEIAALQAEARSAVRGLKLTTLAGAALPLTFFGSMVLPAAAGLVLPVFIGYAALWIVVALRAARRIFAARSKVMAAVAPALGFAFAPRASAPIDLTAFEGTYYASLFKRVRCDDVLSGERGGVAFQIFDAKLLGRSRGPDGAWREGEPPKWLKGVAFAVSRVVRVEVPGRWTSRTVIVPDAGIANRLQQPKGMARVRLVDPAFEKAFEVFSTDQTEARALLTPTVMERLTALESLFDAPKNTEETPPPKVSVFADGALLTALPLARGPAWRETGQQLKLGKVDAAVVDQILWEIDAVLGVVEAVAGPTEPWGEGEAR